MGFGREPPSKDTYIKLMTLLFVETKYIHKPTMEKLGLMGDTRMVFKHMELESLPFTPNRVYKDLTCQFLSTLGLEINNSSSRNSLNLGRIFFSINQRQYRLTLHEVREIWGLKEGNRLSLTSSTFPNMEDGWDNISEEEYEPEYNNSSTIRHPVFKIAHRFLAHTIFNCECAKTVSITQMCSLTAGLTPLFPTCDNEKKEEYSIDGISVAVLLVKKMMHIQDMVYDHGVCNAAKDLRIDGLVIPILTKAGVIPHSDSVESAFLNTLYMQTGKIFGKPAGLSL